VSGVVGATLGEVEDEKDGLEVGELVGGTDGDDKGKPLGMADGIAVSGADGWEVRELLLRPRIGAHVGTAFGEIDDGIVVSGADGWEVRELLLRRRIGVQVETVLGEIDDGIDVSGVVGAALGEVEDEKDGLEVGELVGGTDGDDKGKPLGMADGIVVSGADGWEVRELLLRPRIGVHVKTALGEIDNGIVVSDTDGWEVRELLLRRLIGVHVGTAEGFALGEYDGTAVSAAVSLVVVVVGVSKGNADDVTVGKVTFENVGEYVGNEGVGVTLESVEDIAVGFVVGVFAANANGINEGVKLGIGVESATSTVVGGVVGASLCNADEGDAVESVGIVVGKIQPVKSPNCTSNPLGPKPKLLTLKVIEVIAPRPFALKKDNPTELLFPLKEVIVVDAFLSDTTTETRTSSTEK